MSQNVIKEHIVQKRSSQDMAIQGFTLEGRDRRLAYCNSDSRSALHPDAGCASATPP